MKKIIFSSFILLLLFHQSLLSQNYFGNQEDIPIHQQVATTQGIYFGMERINVNPNYDFLDIAMTQRENDNKIGQWNFNNGNGTFGTYHTFTPEASSDFVGNLFIKLRPDSPVKDFVVGRYNGLQVHLNQNNVIEGVHQNITNSGSNWVYYECGVFDASDNVEDVLVSNGTPTLRYFKNNNDGYLQDPVSVTLPQPFTVFKLRQLNEKTDGYVQLNPLDRSDIIFIDQSQLPHKIYAYLNANNNGFEPSPCAIIFNTVSPTEISNLDVADLDGDGYNDIIALFNDEQCGTHYTAQAYRNVHGVIYNTPFWSYALNPNYTASCIYYPKISAPDLNKDGLNDLVFVIERPGVTPGIYVYVFINQNGWPIYTQVPQETIEISEPYAPTIIQAMTADIYGGQTHDGGGIALSISYFFTDEPGSTFLHVKVVNADELRKHSPPPPPIVQKFLRYFPEQGIWRPHLHLNNRGERDFDHYEIWKYKEPQGLHCIQPYCIDTGWTDLSECVNATGEDNIFWNCYYYAKSVDYENHHVSIPSKIAYYLVDCIPVCDGCGGDNPYQNLIYLETNPPEKFAISNYPNPFNPVTSIRFTLPKASKVKITVYNTIGQVVRELLDQWCESGTHSVEFNGSNLPSGVYFYRIEAGDFVQSKKMLLIK